MVVVSGSYRSTRTESVVVEGSSVDAARDELAQKVGPGHEIIEVAVSKSDVGVKVTGTIRSMQTTPVRAEADSYVEARDRLRGMVPADNILLGIFVE